MNRNKLTPEQITELRIEAQALAEHPNRRDTGIFRLDDFVRHILNLYLEKYNGSK
jgi:hypothetical protein